MNEDLNKKEIEEITRQIEKFTQAGNLPADILPGRLYILNNSGLVDSNKIKKILGAKTVEPIRTDAFGVEYRIKYE